MPDNKMTEKYGSWALITGASSGIGAAFARELAKKGMNLVLVARREALLQNLAGKLSDNHGIEARALVADLSSIADVDRVLEETSELNIGLLVANAGMEIHQHFAEQSREQIDTLLNVNVTAPTRMAHHFSKQFKKQGKGGILFVSSLMGFVPSTHLAQYSASKAYITTLAEGLHYELKDSSVDVTVVSPGMTDTDMGRSVAASMNGPEQKMMTPEQVARQALDGLGAKPVVVPGLSNQLSAFMFTRLLPRRFMPAVSKRLFQAS